MKDANYNDVRDNFDTGDIVLFSGNCLISRVIQRFSKSIWSHVGVVYKDRALDVVHIMEATGLGGGYNGIRFTPLRQRVAEYLAQNKGTIVVNTYEAERDYEAFAMLRRELDGVAYEKNLSQLVFAAIDIPGIDFENESDLSSVFCSEMAAHIWQGVDWLSNELPPDEFTPGDFDFDSGAVNDYMIRNLIKPIESWRIRSV